MFYGSLAQVNLHCDYNVKEQYRSGGSESGGTVATKGGAEIADAVPNVIERR